jgi:electron transfer flavoprotein alpha subunit
MSRVLIIAEHGAQSLDATAKCVRCATGIPDAQIDVAFFGNGIGAQTAAAARLAGVSRVLAFDAEDYRHALAAALAPQIARLAPDYTHLLAPSTTFGKDLLPRVAALVDGPMISDIMAVESAQRFRRPIYAGNAILTVEVADAALVLGTVRIASFEAVPAEGSAVVESRAVESPPVAHTRFVGLAASGGDRPDLQSARRVVSGGRALGSAEKFQLVYQLADSLGAAVGASRAAVDAGYAPNDLQVGQTGKIIAPELYMAVGISGAIQHMTGIKDARTIVAINKDADAPIFEAADFGLVADLFEVLPQLTAALKTRAG